jgi:hypothetical protein
LQRTARRRLFLRDIGELAALPRVSPRRPALRSASPTHPAALPAAARSLAGPSNAPVSARRAALRVPVLIALLAAAPLGEAPPPREAIAPTAPAQISGLLRQLNLRARPAPRDVNRCRSSACRAATASRMA